jgi:hypothetical protein
MSARATLRLAPVLLDVFGSLGGAFLGTDQSATPFTGFYQDGPYPIPHAPGGVFVQLDFTSQITIDALTDVYVVDAADAPGFRHGAVVETVTRCGTGIGQNGTAVYPVAYVAFGSTTRLDVRYEEAGAQLSWNCTNLDFDISNRGLFVDTDLVAVRDNGDDTYHLIMSDASAASPGLANLVTVVDVGDCTAGPP